MKRVFGQKKATNTPPPASLQDASSGVGKRVDHLDAKISALDNELRGYKEKMRTSRGGAKQNYQKRAMDVLKRKRMYEQQREQLAGQQFNIEQASFNIESAKDTLTTVSAMKSANTQFKAQMKQMNLNDIDDMADDMIDMMDDMNEVNEMLSRNYATPDAIDESDLQAELDMLDDELAEDEVEADATPSYLQPSSLPAQPTTAPGQRPNASQVDEYGLPLAQHG